MKGDPATIFWKIFENELELFKEYMLNQSKYLGFSPNFSVCYVTPTEWFVFEYFKNTLAELPFIARIVLGTTIIKNI